MNGWRTSFGISNEVSGKHPYHRALERMGSWSLAVERNVVLTLRVRNRSGRAKRQSQRLMVFQGMRALETYGDRKSDIEKVSRNVAKTLKSITGEQSA